MLNPQEAALESVAERIARIITREYGISVRIGGLLAYMDLEKRQINLPDLTNEEISHLDNMLDGFLDHECGHGKFTDVEAFNRANFKGGQKHYIWNVIEDFWIERAMGELYVGCKQNIDKLNKEIVIDIKGKWNECDALNKLLFAFSQIWRGETPIIVYADDPLIGSMLPLFQEEIDAGFCVRSTQSAIDLTYRILDKIKILAECFSNKDNAGAGKDNAGKDSAGKDNAGKDNAGKDNAGKDNAGSAGKDGNANDNDDADNDNIMGTDNSINSGFDKVREESKQGDENENEEKNTVTEDTGLADQNKGLEQAANLQADLDTGAFQPSKLDKENFFNKNLDNLRDRFTKDDPDEYYVFSRAYDYDTEFPLATREKHTELYKRLVNEVRDYVGNMATKLALSLLAETEAYWVGGARRGRKWDKRILPQWYLGGEDERLWKKLEQGEQWDTAVSLLWDCSGSMGSNSKKDHKSHLARLAAIAFHEALLRANIVHEVLGFHTGGRVPTELNDAVTTARNNGNSLRQYSRLDETDQRLVFVPFGSPDGRAICEINGSGANRDGECVLWAAKRLAARPEKRKILIVGSDGQPSGAYWDYTEKKYLQAVVRNIINSGIEVLAIGIMNSSVQRYYPNWVLINQATDLPTVVMEQITLKLFQRGRTCVKFPKLFSRTGNDRGL